MTKDIGTNPFKYFELVGISPHLESGALGHLESFHKSLFKEMNSYPGVYNPIYLGLRNQKNNERNWYLSIVPRTITQKFKWVDIKYFRNLQNIASGNGSNASKLFITYEGDLFLILFMSALLRTRPKAFAIVNIFDSQKYSNYLDSKRGRFLFNLMCRLALCGLNSRLIITADTTRFAKKIHTSTGLQLKTFPVFSTITPSENLRNDQTNIMINLRGSDAQNKLLEVCNSIGSKRLPKMYIHGLTSREMEYKFSKFNSVKLSSGHITEDRYQSLYQEFTTVIFMYDPKGFSLQSSGRLCDAIVTCKEIIVPKETALSDLASMYGNSFEFDFNNISSLRSILTGQYKTSEQKNAPLPTSRNAVQNLISMIECSSENDNMILGGMLFWVICLPGWLVSGLFHFANAVKYRALRAKMTCL